MLSFVLLLAVLLTLNGCFSSSAVFRRRGLLKSRVSHIVFSVVLSYMFLCLLRFSIPSAHFKFFILLYYNVCEVFAMFHLTHLRTL